MPESPLISVIVPVYNVEKYLRKCLDSICGQTYRNLEILCVNDGSTDGSAAILEEYAAKDARIKVFTQANAGQGAARNLALDNAHGTWITGVDSDDYLEPDAYEYAVTGIQEEVDIVCFGTHIHAHNHTPEPRLEALFEYPLTGSHKPDISGVVYTNDVFWNKLWRKSLIDRLSLRFPEGLWYEDSYFWRAAAPFSRCIHFLPGKKINYVRHAASTMSQVFRKSEKTLDRVAIIRLLLDFYDQHPLPQHLQHIKPEAFVFYFNAALSDVPHELRPQVWTDMRRIAQEHRLFEQWPERLKFLRPVPLLLRPFVCHQSPNKSSYGIPGFRPLVIQHKNGMKIIRFLGIKLHRTPY